MPDVNIARDPGHTGAAPVDSPPASRRQRTPQVHIRPDWNRTFRSRSIEVSPPSTVAAMIPYTIGASTLKDTRRPSSSHPRGSAYTARAHGRFVAGKRFEAARRRARPPSCGWRVAAGGPADPGARPGPLRRLVDLGDRAGPVDGRHRRVRHGRAVQRRHPRSRQWARCARRRPERPTAAARRQSGRARSPTRVYALCDARDDLALASYAADAPEEFFSVASKFVFELPETVADEHPAI